MRHIPTILFLSASMALISCDRGDKQIESEEVESTEGYSSLTFKHDLSEVSDAEFAFGDGAGTVQWMATANNGSESDITRIIYEDKIIRTAYIGMELKDYEKGKLEILNITKKLDGILVKENENSNYQVIRNELTIKVPSESFDEFLNSLGDGIGNFDYKRISTEDVGEEYYDLKTRIKTKKAMEERYLSFLSKAKNIEELLKIEFEIRKIREEIESKEGRLKYLSNRVSFSTIHLTIYQNLDFDRPISERPGFGNKMLSALRSGWNSVLRLFIGITHAWPYLLLLVLIAIPIYRRVIKPAMQVKPKEIDKVKN